MALDFVRLRTRLVNKTVHGYLIFNLEVDSRDLMIRGGDFYAIWDDENKQWSTSEKTLIRLLDKELKRLAQEQHLGDDVTLDYAWDSESGTIDRFHKFCQKQARDYFQNLDERLVWSNTEPRRENYASHSLPYPLESGTIDAWDKIVGTLYQPSERKKIEWVIGAIVTGDSARLQKFLVFYGAQGTGKSTIINIIEMLFEGYTASFMAKDLGSANAQFALEAFKNNPLVGIQHDGTLARIEDNTRLNSLVSHEKLLVNAKYSKMYESAFKTFLIMGTNEPVKITNARSGLLRRLIDVEPSGNKLPIREYNRLMKQVKFELGAIAWHCKEVYEEDPEYYDDYVPIRMMGATNDFFNFLISCYPVFKKEDGTTLKAAWESYKTWTDEAKVAYPYPLRIFKEELKDYFETFEETFDSEGGRVKNWYGGFKVDKFKDQLPTDATITKKKRKEPVSDSWIVFEEQHSVFDDICGDCPAQYASEEGTPTRKWDSVRTKLAEVNTHKLHYVKVPLDHIVIDFDIPDEHGNKCLEKNLEAASKFPPTYAELSKSGQGIHLHYFYTGDPEKLCRIYEEHVEVKVFTGLSSLRRMLTKCNNLPIANISSGLPLKGEKAMVNFDGVITEKGLRTTIIRCLNKEIHADTTSNVSMILKVLTDAYNSGIHYDVSDMYNAVLAFASKSTNQADKCLKMVTKMQFRSEEASENHDRHDVPIVFFDCEVFPNLFLVCWKFQGEGKPVNRMVNPSPTDIEELLKYRLIGFNNRDYDNHMLYACLIGYTTEQIHKLSHKIINEKQGKFREAYNLSYTDIFDFSSKKQSLKKFEIELGIHHQELGFDWDKPVPEEMWHLVAEYCDNDVIATEAVFNARQGDFRARQILAELANGTVNDTTNSLAIKFIFGNEKKPQLVYTDLATGEQTYGR